MTPLGSEQDPAPHPNPLPVKNGGEGSAEEQERDARAHRVLGALCLPGLRLHHRRDRAAAVFVQRAGRRLPHVRRPRHRTAVRGRPRGARCGTVAGQGRRLSLVAHRRHLALLRADADGAGQALQGVDDDALAAAAQARAAGDPLRHRRRGRRVHLRGRPAHLQNVQAVRGRDRQHPAALERDRQRVGARRAVALPECASVRSVQRLSPEAAGAEREDRRQAHRRGRRPVDQGGQHLVCRGAEVLHQEADRDRHAHPEGDPRAPAVPQRRRPRLPDAVARLRHAVGRREPAHPARLADRLRLDRRALRARRAVDRPAPARQRAPAR